MFTPFKIDCQNLRQERQRENNKLMYHALISQQEELVRHHCNNNELHRVLTELSEVSERQFTLKRLVNKCGEDKIYAMTLAGRISKASSR